METKQAILERRSVRKFSNKQVEKELLIQLAEAGYSAPSACNKKPYKISIITNKELIDKLDSLSRFKSINSPCIIVVSGDLSKTLPKAWAEYWIQDASAVTQNILIMAQSLGLSTCWNGLYPQKVLAENVRVALNLGENFVPMSLIHVGYGEESLPPHSGFDEKVVDFIE